MRGEREKVFLDASVFIAAAGSRSGGSSLVLEVCGGRRFRAATTTRILFEAYKNIRKKLPEEAIGRFYRQLAASDLEVVSPPSEEALERCEELVPRKDCHVLAAAVKSQAPLLITLDRKRFQSQTVERANLGLAIFTPKEFLDTLRGEVEGS